MRAVGYKGHLGCIEILKAKAAITSDRVAWIKHNRKKMDRGGGGGEGNNERISYSLLLLPGILQIEQMEGRKSAEENSL